MKWNATIITQHIIRFQLSIFAIEHSIVLNVMYCPCMFWFINNFMLYIDILFSYFIFFCKSPNVIKKRTGLLVAVICIDFLSTISWAILIHHLKSVQDPIQDICIFVAPHNTVRNALAEKSLLIPYVFRTGCSEICSILFHKRP